jgi:hypothetical protein
MRDRDPAVRRAAVRSLKALRSDDPADKAARDAAAKDPAASVAREVPRKKPKPRPPEKTGKKTKPCRDRPPKAPTDGASGRRNAERERKRPRKK